jgi:propanol-preferring alcohol dehydrogenase
MRAAVLEAIAPIESAPLRIVDRAIPEPGADEVRVRVHCCAVCRTDLHIIEGELPPRTLPIVPGHQIIGTIHAVGSAVTDLAIGERVGIAWLRGTCGTCRPCQVDRENLCENAAFTGYHADGGYADYATVRADFAYPIPAAFADTDAAPLLCAGIIGYRALKRSRIEPGQRLALYGFGSSAHIVMQIALHRGCDVYVVSRTESHHELARRMGARWVGRDASQMPDKADSAIIFAPAGPIVPAALEQLAPGGTLALAGIYMSPVPPLDYERHLFHERDIHSVTANTRADARELLAEAAEIPIRPTVTTYPLADANRALQDLKADRIAGTGVLVIKQA